MTTVHAIAVCLIVSLACLVLILCQIYVGSRGKTADITYISAFLINVIFCLSILGGR